MRVQFTYERTVHMTPSHANRAAVALALGGALWSVAALVGGADGGDHFYLAESIWLPAQLALLLGTVELWRARLHGMSRAGTAGSAIATVGRVAFVLAEVLALTTGEIQESVLPAAIALTALGMIIAGVAVLRARKLETWRRWVVLGAGAYPLLFMIPFAAILGEPPAASLIGWGAALVVVGVAARESDSSTLANAAARP